MAHDLAQAEQAANVVGVILKRLGHALTHGFVRGKMHHRRNALAGKQRMQRCLIAHIHALKLRCLAAELLQTAQHLW
jgi:hypothetical protein